VSQTFTTARHCAFRRERAVDPTMIPTDVEKKKKKG